MEFYSIENQGSRSFFFIYGFGHGSFVHLVGNLYYAYEILYFACFALIDKLNGWMPWHWVILAGRLSFIFHKHSHLDSLEGQWWGLSLRARKITCLNSLNNGLASLTQVPEMKSHLPMGQSNFHKSLPLADEQSELSRMGIQWFLCAPEHNDWDVSTSLFA